MGFQQKTVLRRISLEFYEGEISALLGHNGAGKSTLLSLICGAQRVNEGTIKSYSVKLENQKQTKIAYCPQNYSFYDEMTVAENLRLIAVVGRFSQKFLLMLILQSFRISSQIKGFWGCNAEKEITRVSELVGLESESQTIASNLSGGKKRALNIAQSIIGRSADVLAIDEPTTGLVIASIV
jgi:ABC-type multidrug transport system ATPase subunit